MSDNNVKTELAEYKRDISEKRKRLLNLKTQIGHQAPHMSQLDLLLVATEGLLTKIEGIDPLTISLSSIVFLADEVQVVMRHSTHFLENQHPKIVAA